MNLTASKPAEHQGRVTGKGGPTGQVSALLQDPYTFTHPAHAGLRPLRDLAAADQE